MVVQRDGMDICQTVENNLGFPLYHWTLVGNAGHDRKFCSVIVFGDILQDLTSFLDWFMLTLSDSFVQFCPV